MPTFDIDVYVVKTETYRVQADNEYRAVKFWDDGELIKEIHHDIQVGSAIEVDDAR